MEQLKNGTASLLVFTQFHHRISAAGSAARSNKTQQLKWNNRGSLVQPQCRPPQDTASRPEFVQLEYLSRSTRKAAKVWQTDRYHIYIVKNIKHVILQACVQIEPIFGSRSHDGYLMFWQMVNKSNLISNCMYIPEQRNFMKYIYKNNGF